jgi:hypothetical protein
MQPLVVQELRQEDSGWSPQTGMRMTCRLCRPRNPECSSESTATPIENSQSVAALVVGRELHVQEASVPSAEAEEAVSPHFQALPPSHTPRWAVEEAWQEFPQNLWMIASRHRNPCGQVVALLELKERVPIETG